MGDLAELGLRFTTQGADAAERHLDAITEKSERAERATDSLSKGYGDAGTATGQMGEKIRETLRTQEEAIRHVKSLGDALGGMAGDALTGATTLEKLSADGAMAARSLLGLGGRAAVAGGLVAGLTATAAAGAMAWRDYDASVKQAENALLGIGRGTGLTVTQFRELAAEAAKAGGMAERAAQDMANSYVRAGVTNSGVLKDLISLTQRYATATDQELAAAQGELTRALDGSRSGLEFLEGRLGTVDDKTRQHLLTLIEQNRLVEYQKIVVRLLGDEFSTTAVKVGGLDQALKNMSRTWSNVWGSLGQGFGNFFRIGEGVEEQLARRNLQSGLGYDPIRERLQQQQATAQAQAKANADQAEHNNLMRDARAAMEALMPWERDRAARLGQISTIQRAIKAHQDANPGSPVDPQLAAALRAAQVSLNQIDELAARDGARRPPSNRGEINRLASLGRELEAMRATAQANRDLAAAYGESDEAGLRAAARAEVVGRAVKRQGDIEAFVAAQLQVNASKAAVDAAKTIADLEKTNEGRERMNAAMVAGTITAQQANDQLALDAELRPLIAAAAVVEGDAKRYLEAQIEALTEARKREILAAREEAIIQAQIGNRDRLQVLQLERDLIGANNIERARQIAMLEEEIRLRNLYGQAFVDSREGQQLIGDAGAARVFEGENQRRTALENQALTEQLDLLRQIDDHMRSATQGLSDGFGNAGRAVGEAVSAFTTYRARLEEIRVAQEQLDRDGLNTDLRRVMAARDRGQAEMEAYGAALGAAKGFFREGSDGYRALQAAEAAWRVFQFAMSVQAMAQGAAETSAHVAQSGVKAAASTAAGAAKMFEALGPFGFPVVAAMLALLASLGLRGGGGGKSSGGGDVSSSVSAVQANNAQQDQARASFASTVAQKVEVRVTADRDGLKAYVAGVAEDTARPMVMQGMAATAGAVRAQVAQDMDPTYRRGG